MKRTPPLMTKSGIQIGSAYWPAKRPDYAQWLEPAQPRSLLANPYFWQLAGAALLIWICIGIGLYAFFFGGAK